MDSTDARRAGQARWAWWITLALVAPCAAQSPRPMWSGTGPAPPGAVVIASSRPTTPVESLLPPPDDGLHTTPPARLQLPVVRAVVPRSLPQTIVQAAYTPPVVRASGSALQVDMQGPARVPLGKPMSCTLRVRNAGVELLTEVQIVLPLPSGTKLVETAPAARTEAAGLTWQLGSLRPGEERSLRVDLMPPDAAELRLHPQTTFRCAGLRLAILRPPLALTATGPEKATVGERTAFVIRVTNNTPSMMRRVYLGCRLPAGLSHAQGQFIEAELPGPLAPGQTREERVETKCLAPGQARLNFTARADGGLAVQCEASLTVAEPALLLEVAGPRNGCVGQEMEYRLAVRNPGLGGVGASVLSVALPEGVELVQAGEGGQYNSATRMVAWSLPALASQGRCAAKLKVRGQKAGDWAFAGVVTVSGARTARHRCAVRVEQPPLLTMDLSRLNDPLRVGEETTYEVRVYNQGPAAVARMQVRFELPAHLLPVQGDGPGRWHIHGQAVTFEPMEKMPARIDAMFKVRVRAVSVGSGRLRATTTAGGLHVPMVRESTANVR